MQGLVILVSFTLELLNVGEEMITGRLDNPTLLLERLNCP